ncbi:DUF1572 family protein [uncultured Chryseobacterium sp.]|uniref:DinB family protein n=1 Tax=uncultured Chryseobacterium sp. TaxID=259322 RepID=UPI00260020B1|nr:DUF1572 family protein [uncultured Chryseobacterium sp.]
MITKELQSLFIRDLTKLKTEIEAYRDEKTVWKTDKDILNSAGNLCLHLVGNLNTYIGAQLGNSGYIRQRDLEFSLKDLPGSELVGQIEKTMEMILFSFGKLTEEDLKKEYPIEPLGYKMTTGYFLIHLLGHLNYHLGQVNYHRRLLDAL